MVALSFKLPESVVESLRSLSRRKGISQTKIIEESLISWIEKEELSEIEQQFRAYSTQIQNDSKLAQEEAFLTGSTMEDSLPLLQKEHA
jgi:hypothetical protein